MVDLYEAIYGRILKNLLKILPLVIVPLIVCSTKFNNKDISFFKLELISNDFHPLQYELWESMFNYNLSKEQILHVLSQYYPYDTMNQRVFFFDPKLDKPYSKIEKQGIYGTEEVQKIIYENQYPKNCSEREFLLVPVCSASGIGSYLHVLGSYIALGIDLNRTVVYDPNDTHRYSKCSQCKGTNGFDCYFQPMSSCHLSKEEINYKDDRYMKASSWYRYFTRKSIPDSVKAIISKTARVV